MRNWHAVVCAILIWSIPQPTANFRTQEMSLIPAKFVPTPKTVTPKTGVTKMIPNSIAVFFGQTEKTESVGVTVSVVTADDERLLKESTSVRTIAMPHAEISRQNSTDPKPEFAGVPHNFNVTYLLFNKENQKVAFNVSWVPRIGKPTREYSLAVNSMTNSSYCYTSLCYDYTIPGNVTWWLIPQSSSNKEDTSCALHPGCAYVVDLIAHPSDRNTTANFTVQLRDCEVGVCSCLHEDDLPIPAVTSARIVTIKNEKFAEITWTLPNSNNSEILQKNLTKKSYIIGVYKHQPGNRYPHNATFTTVKAKGLVQDGETAQSLIIKLGSERARRNGKDLRAGVRLIDERGCQGQEMRLNFYIAEDPVKPSVTDLSFGAYATLVALIGVWAMGAVLVLSARVVKRVLKSFRPAPVSAPLEPLRCRPAWFPLQLRMNNENPVRGQMEESPLYTQKDFEIEEGCDEWEVSRSRVHLGSLIGSGAFGRVHAAQLDMPGGETITVAAKMLTGRVSEDEVQDFLREIVMLKHVGSHKHVIRLIACCTRKAPLIALLEHAPRGDLLSLLRAARARRKESFASDVTKKMDSSQGRPSEADSDYTNLSDSDPALSDDDSKLYADCDKKKDHYVAEPALQLDGSTMREYALQVALGMRHLEERGITHRDLAARNILVDGAGLLKVADFGLSRSGVYVHTRSRPVPLRWLAPEAILYSQYCGASDVWAFAVLLWEIATLGGFPYAELSNQHVPPFLAGGGRLQKPVRASPTLYQLMVECWSENPTDRPTFSEIVDKLTVQKQLYIDLDCVFPPSEEEIEGLRHFEFKMAAANGHVDR